MKCCTCGVRITLDNLYAVWNPKNGWTRPAMSLTFIAEAYACCPEHRKEIVVGSQKS